MMPANDSCTTIREHVNQPSSLAGPYMPDTTYTKAVAMLSRMPNSFCTLSNSWRSSFTLWSNTTSLRPVSSCIIILDVMMGLMPSSMSVPLLD